MSKQPFTYRKLFVSMLVLSAFTFGGGYVIVCLMHKKFVDSFHWLEDDELTDLIAIAQAAPGPGAVNAALLVGHRLGGVWGGVLSVIATVLPSLITLSIIAYAYDAFRSNALVSAILKMTQAAVAAVIADVVIDMGGKVVRGGWVSILIMAAAFAATYWLGVNIALILLACGVIGAVRVLLVSRRAGV